MKGLKERHLAFLLALARSAFCAYRAFSQSLAGDEAFTFNAFVEGPWSSIYRFYDANNHVLYSMLAKLSIRVFGLSEFTLRLPAVAAGFFLILGIFAILESICAQMVARWVALVALALHPLLLDFSTAARGYGMGVAFLVWGIYAAMRGRYLRVGILLGLAASANLTIAFPALGLSLAVFLVDSGPAKRRIGRLLLILGPAMGLFALICAVPMATATRANFYAGQPTIGQSLLDLTYVSLHSVGKTTGLFGTYPAAETIARTALPLTALLIAISFGWARVWRLGHAKQLIPATLVITLAGLVAAHYLFALNYPVDRTGLYLFVLFGITWAIAADSTGNKPLGILHILLAGLLTIQFATQLQARTFYAWAYDRDARQIGLLLKERTAGRPPGSTTVSATVYHQPALEFYRKYLHIDALRPVERTDVPPLTGYDYYVRNYPDTARMNASEFNVLLSDPPVGVIFAIRAK